MVGGGRNFPGEFPSLLQRAPRARKLRGWESEDTCHGTTLRDKPGGAVLLKTFDCIVLPYPAQLSAARAGCALRARRRSALPSGAGGPALPGAGRAAAAPGGVWPRRYL